MKSKISVLCFLCAVLLALCACVSVAAEEISPQQEASRQEGSASADKAPPAFAVPAEEERAVDLCVLVSDLAAVREAEDLITEDLEALQDSELAAFITEKWYEIYMNPDYRLYLDGKDDPAVLPVSGKHAFVVLGFELENGEMRDELKARCDAAAVAARVFPESVLVCSGGATGKNNPDGHTEAGLMKEYLVKTCGLAPERILTDERAMSTLENAVNTFSILKDQKIEAITLVTSSYHQHRANILYQTLAEIIRETEGISVTVAGNYGCDIQASDRMAKNDARIAAMQLNEMIKTLLPDDPGEKE